MNLAKTPIALCRRQDQVRRDDGAVEPITQPGRRPFRQRTPGHPTRSGPAHPSRKPAARPAPRPSADGRRGVRRFSADAVGPWRPAKWTGDDRVSPGSRPKPQPPAHAPRRLPDRAEPGHPAAGSDRVPCRRSHRAGGCARTPSPPGGGGTGVSLGRFFHPGRFCVTSSQVSQLAEGARPLPVHRRPCGFCTACGRGACRKMALSALCRRTALPGCFSLLAPTAFNVPGEAGGGASGWAGGRDRMLLRPRSCGRAGKASPGHTDL